MITPPDTTQPGRQGASEHAVSTRTTFLIRRLGVGTALLVVVVIAWSCVAGDSSPPSKTGDDRAAEAPRTTESTIDRSVFSDPDRVGKPWSKEVPGSLTFRGNPAGTFYGNGPVPSQPKVDWFIPA